MGDLLISIIKLHTFSHCLVKKKMLDLQIVNTNFNYAFVEKMMTHLDTVQLAKRNLSNFFYGEGDDILDTINSFDEWWTEAYQEGYYLFQETLSTAPESVIKVCSNKDGDTHELINFSSYNYLGMSTLPEVKDAVADAIYKYGLGSCGGPILSGRINKIVSSFQKARSLYTFFFWLRC
jgi:hypothetical protein